MFCFTREAILYAVHHIVVDVLIFCILFKTDSTGLHWQYGWCNRKLFYPYCKQFTCPFKGLSWYYIRPGITSNTLVQIEWLDDTVIYTTFWTTNSQQMFNLLMKQNKPFNIPLNSHSLMTNSIWLIDCWLPNIQWHYVMIIQNKLAITTMGRSYNKGGLGQRSVKFLP